MGPVLAQNRRLSGHVVDTLFFGELVSHRLILIVSFGPDAGFLPPLPARQQGRAPSGAKSWRWEIGWTSATLVAFLVLFVWGADALHLALSGRRRGDLEIYVVGKQWMWKIQHPGGQREIDELHVPVGKSGAARDGLAGRHPQLLHPGVPHQAGRRARASTRRSGSRPTQPGDLSARLRGVLRHRARRMMGGTSIVMEPADYAALARPTRASSGTLAQQGEALFRQHRLQRLPWRRAARCMRRRWPGSTAAPVQLAGRRHRRRRRALYPRLHPLPARRSSPAIRRSCRPSPGQIGEDDLLKLVAYIKSLVAAKERRR